MANRRFVFEKNWAANPPPRRPATTRAIPPGVPPAEGQDPPEGWTPVRIECSHFRRPDGTPEILLLYGRPCSPDAAARQQQHWQERRTIDRGQQQQQDHRWSPEPHQVDGATRVVRLAEMLSLGDLQDDELYQDVLDDVTEEARKFGDLLKVVVPRPGHAGAGKVFLEYACVDDSVRCRIRLDGRWFAGRKVVSGYFPEDRFAAGDYDYESTTDNVLQAYAKT